MSRNELEDLVAEFIEQSELGAHVDPASFARQHPEFERELLAALAALEEAESLWPADARALPPSVGPYTVLGEIGSGGMGRVLRVTSPAYPGCDIALKLLHPSAALDPRSAERFRREGEILKTLRHEHIVAVHEVGMIGSSPYIVMDRVEGQSLAQVIRAARERPAKASELASDRLDLPGQGSGHRRVALLVSRLARAVTQVHAAGALHRDVKPANVILRADGNPVLVDFGLVHSSTGATLTRTGDLVGTPQYMPPEQARGESTDERADVYGLGALLFELLTLTPPHAGDEVLQVLEQVRNQPAPRIRARAPDVPRALAIVVQRALAFRVRHRTASALELAQDLDNFLAGKPVSARTPSIVERMDGIWIAHKRKILSAVVSVLLAVGCGLGWQRHASSERLAAESSFDLGLRAWLEHDETTALAHAQATLEHRPDQRWAGLLESMLRNGELVATEDSAVLAAAAGWKEHVAKDHAAAVADFSRAAELAPGEAFPVVLLGLEAELAGDHDRARGELSAAVRLVPRSARLMSELGSVLYARRELDAAEKAFESSLEVAPDDPRVWECLARTRHQLGHFAPGLEASQRAYDLAGEQANSRVLMTHGALLEVAGRRAEARIMFERAKEISPEAVNPPISIAMSLDSDHKLREAADAYWKASQSGPPSKPMMCLAYLYAGSRSSECPDCRRVYAENPDLLDADRAESCALGALESDDGKEPGLPATAAMVARQIERRDAIRAKLEALRGAATEDLMIARYEKALRMLRKP